MLDNITYIIGIIVILFLVSYLLMSSSNKKAERIEQQQTAEEQIVAERKEQIKEEEEKQRKKAEADELNKHKKIFSINDIIEQKQTKYGYWIKHIFINNSKEIWWCPVMHKSQDTEPSQIEIDQSIIEQSKFLKYKTNLNVEIKSACIITISPFEYKNINYKQLDKFRIDFNIDISDYYYIINLNDDTIDKIISKIKYTKYTKYNFVIVILPATTERLFESREIPIALQYKNYLLNENGGKSLLIFNCIINNFPQINIYDSPFSLFYFDIFIKIHKIPQTETIISIIDNDYNSIMYAKESNFNYAENLELTIKNFASKSGGKSNKYIYKTLKYIINQKIQ